MTRFAPAFTAFAIAAFLVLAPAGQLEAQVFGKESLQVATHPGDFPFSVTRRRDSALGSVFFAEW